jgi:hypothetical protein
MIDAGFRGIRYIAKEPKEVSSNHHDGLRCEAVNFRSIRNGSA